MDFRQELEQEEPIGQGEKFEFYSDCTKKLLGVWWWEGVKVLSSGMRYLFLWRCASGDKN